MKQHELKQKLETVVTFKKHRKEDPWFDRNDNILNPEIEAFKNQQRVCEDCGHICQQRRVSWSKYLTPEPHWRRHCHACHKTQDPNTGKFTLVNSQVGNAFRKYWNNLRRDK